MEETFKIILDKLNSMDSDIKDLKKHVVVMNSDIKNLEKHVVVMDSDIKDLKKHVVVMDADIKDLKKHVVVIENEHGAKLDSLLDGYKQVYEEQIQTKNDIKDMKEILNVHEVKLLKVK